jgi:hypothetical protein
VPSVRSTFVTVAVSWLLRASMSNSTSD